MLIFKKLKAVSLLHIENENMSTITKENAKVTIDASPYPCIIHFDAGPSRAPMAPGSKMEIGASFQTKKFQNLKFCEYNNYQFLAQHIVFLRYKQFFGLRNGSLIKTDN